MKITHHCRECGEQVVEIDGEDMYCPGHPGAVIESRLDGPNGNHPTDPNHLLDLARLTCTETVRIVTSGYDDRYLMGSRRWNLPLIGGRGHLSWGDRGDAIDTIEALTGLPHDDIYTLVQGCPYTCWSTYTDGLTSGSVAVRGYVLSAIADLATDQTRPRLADAARARAREMAMAATEDEKRAAKWWLRECNRTNAELEQLGARRPGTTQTTTDIASLISDDVGG